jgi:hypothetical protein
VSLVKDEIVLDPSDDDAYGLVVAVAAGEIDDVHELARRIRRLRPRRAGRLSAPGRI